MARVTALQILKMVYINSEFSILDIHRAVVSTGPSFHTNGFASQGDSWTERYLYYFHTSWRGNLKESFGQYRR